MRLRARDVVGEAVAAVAARPGRALLTAAGTVLGVGALVATLGLTTTARSQVSAEFDAVAATEVRVEAPPPAEPGQPVVLPADAEARVARIVGVEGAGVLWAVDTGGARLRSGWSAPPSAGEAAMPVFAATPAAIDAMDLDVVAGRAFDAFHERRAERVVLLSRAAANALGVEDLHGHPVVLAGDVPLTVLGIYDGATRRREVVGGAVVPTGTARALWGTATTRSHEVLVEVRPGAAHVVADQVAIAVRPDAPERLSVTAPPDPRSLRQQVDDQLAALFLLIGAVSVGAGAFTIANTTLVAVLERVPEIGLRRAVGARRIDIAGQFLVESAGLGTLGGVLGAALGVLVTAVVCLVQGWTATVDLVPVLAAPLVGTVSGLVAGLQPAVRAARVDPVAALQR